jgi:hypothetical protein
VEGKRRVLLIIHPIQIRTPAGRSLVADHSHVQNWIQLTSNLDGLSRSSADGGETGSIGKRCKRQLPRLGCPFALPHASRARPRHRLQRTSCCGRRVVVWVAETDCDEPLMAVGRCNRPGDRTFATPFTASGAMQGQGTDAVRALDTRPFRTKIPSHRVFREHIGMTDGQ